MNKTTETSVANANDSDSGERSVKPFELFFDLVFVFAFIQVTQLAASELSWGGLGHGVLLLTALWMVWQSYAWLGTTINLDEGAVRLVMLIVMGGMLLVALAVPNAFKESAVLFAVGYAFVRLMHLVLYGIASRKIDGLPRALLRLARSAIVGPMIILVGAVSEVGPLEAWWAAALLLELGAVKVLKMSGFRVSPLHYSERHGLVFIVVLGEAVISIGIGASGLVLDSGVLISSLLGFAIIVTMWWTYFDVNALIARRRLTSLKDEARAKFARDAYSYPHLPMIIGGIFFSLGVKTTLAHSYEALDVVPAVALCGGLILYLFGQVAFRGKCDGSLSIPRVLTIMVLVVLIGVSELVSALTLLAAVSLVFVLLVVYETVAGREFRRQIRSDKETNEN